MIDRGAKENGTFSFTDADFQMIARYAAREYGLDLKIEKKGLIYARLAKRIRTLGMHDFKQYCEFATGRNNVAESSELLSALTTNVTSFFREKHHFDMLSKSVLPNLKARIDAGQKVRIWSAGCSAGPEPFSIAATIHQAFPNASHGTFEILATDVDRHILDKARVGKYRLSEVAGLDDGSFSLLFGGKKDDRPAFEIRQEIRSMVKLKELNLVGNWTHDQPFDVIFCRNVVIYFERTTQHKLWRRFHDCLRPKGRLFIGHSERLSGDAEALFKNVGITAFERSA